MATKLLSLAAGAATVALASSSRNAVAAPSKSTIGNDKHRRLAAQTTPRFLEDGDGGSYAYLDDLSGYSLKYSNCLRVKIPQENDDDAVEGNVNFYNGAYRAQYQVYAAFHVCGDGSGSDQCSSCDYGTEYATEVGEYLETALGHWEDYCDACQEACGGRRLEEEAQLDCNTCSNSCADYAAAGDDDASDETNYLECAEAFVEDDLQLYYGPQCSDDGRLAIGVFYDDECTIKTKHDGPSLDYYKFSAVLDGCVDCSDQVGGNTCPELYGNSYHCFSGVDQTGQDDEMGVCSAVKKAFTAIDYSGVKKRRSHDTFLKVFFGLLAASCAGGALFLMYTYYVRHRGEKGRPMLSGEDVHEEEGDAAPAAAGEGEAPPGAVLT